MNGIAARLKPLLGDIVREDLPTRQSHRRDRWILGELDSSDDSLPAAVLEPTCTNDVVKAVNVCRSERIPVVTYAGGSGVCGAIRGSAESVMLSTRRLTGLVELDPVAMLATFRAGTIGLDAERCIESHGMTIGHFPQSIEISTVGGWVATRSSGQCSTAYGNIEDLAIALEVVLPDGRVLRTRRTPRTCAGPDLRQLFLGSEGTLGVITEVTLSLRPRPPSRRGHAFHFAGLVDGLEPIRIAVQAGWRPAVVRLHDAVITARRFPQLCSDGRCLLILVHEGPEAAVTCEVAALADLCRAHGALDAPAEAVDHWLARRNHVPDLRELLRQGTVAESIEVGCTWDRIAHVYADGIAALRREPGLVSASAHVSHVYRAGASLYFVFFATDTSPEQLADTYRRCWDGLLNAVVRAGASIAHHHGIGRVRRHALTEELGVTGVALLRQLKRALDPADLFNPGVLLPDGDAMD
jgi:alkyldihydroxyacetonephosphate synthase